MNSERSKEEWSRGLESLELLMLRELEDLEELLVLKQSLHE